MYTDIIDIPNHHRVILVS